MCDIPIEIANEEKIVRAIFSSQVDKKTLRKNAFFEPHDDVSVMRHTHMGSDECKRRALQITPGNPNIKYKGLAVIEAKAIRDSNSQVTESKSRRLMILSTLNKSWNWMIDCANSRNWHAISLTLTLPQKLGLARPSNNLLGLPVML